MPQVEADIYIDAEPEHVYELAKNLDSLQDFMENVNSIEVIEQHEDGALSRWDTSLRGRQFAWTERERYDDDALRIDYEQTEGDLSEFGGVWRFQPDGSGTRAHITCRLEFGMPVLASLLNAVAKIAVRDNLQQMMEGLKRYAENERSKP